MEKKRRIQELKNFFLQQSVLLEKLKQHDQEQREQLQKQREQLQTQSEQLQKQREQLQTQPKVIKDDRIDKFIVDNNYRANEVYTHDRFILQFGKTSHREVIRPYVFDKVTGEITYMPVADWYHEKIGELLYWRTTKHPNIRMLTLFRLPETKVPIGR